MRRILHVVTVMDRAGQESFIMNVYRQIDHSKVQFDFLCTSSKKGDFDDEIIRMGGRIYHLPPSKIMIPHVYVLGIIHNLKSFFRLHSEYNLVHFHNYHAYSVLIQLLGAKLGKVKHIVVHSHNTNAPHPFIHKIARPFLKLFKIHRLACSKDAGYWMFGSKSDNFKVIKNGIDPTRFSYSSSERSRIRREFGIEDQKVILHIGRFNYQKNHKFIIDIFEKILMLKPGTHLLLVGRGELENEIKKLVEERNLQENITFTGVRTDVNSLLCASDLFLFPSLFEGLSVVLVETQASGIRILTTSNLSQETIFSESVNQLSTDLSADVWARKAIELLTDYNHTDIRDKVQKSGFDIKKISEELVQFYMLLT